MKHKTGNIQQKGFSMVETIAAIAILGFGIIGTYGAFNAIIISTYNISARFTAAYLAEEGIEVVRNLRDNNFINNEPWDFGLSTAPCGSPGTPGCMLDYKTVNSGQLSIYNDAVLRLNDDGFYGYGSGTPTAFKRKVTISPVTGSNGDALNVDVLVTWTYNGKSFSYDVNEYLYNWY